MELLGQEDVDVRQVVRWLQADAVFSGEMLRVANSAMYGTSGQIRSVHHATITLGLDFEGAGCHGWIAGVCEIRHEDSRAAPLLDP